MTRFLPRASCLVALLGVTCCMVGIPQAYAEDADLQDRSVEVVNATNHTMMLVNSARKGEKEFGNENLIEGWELGPGMHLFTAPENPGEFCKFSFAAKFDNGKWAKSGTMNVCGGEHLWTVYLEEPGGVTTEGFDVENKSSQTIKGLFLGRAGDRADPQNDTLGINYLKTAPVAPGAFSEIDGPFENCTYDIVLQTDEYFYNVRKTNLCGADGSGLIITDAMLPSRE